MVIEGITLLNPQATPLLPMDLPIPEPGSQEVLIKVSVCGVCHTELDEIEGRTPPSVFPMVPGHQVVGTIEKIGDRVSLLNIGDRVGVAWIFSACGSCEFCTSGQENLCDRFKATGRDAFGGYAEYMTAPQEYAYKIPPQLSDVQTAPLLCAGAIGYRSLRLTGLQDGQCLGLTGFGASAHLVLKMAAYKFPHSRVYVFARSETERRFARELGATWSGDTSKPPPEPLDAIIDTTPAWKPVVKALEFLKPGGRLVINAIRKENQDLDEWMTLNYGTHFWMEKEIKSVANITRMDVKEFLHLAAEIPIKPQVQEYTLAEANQALIDLKFKAVRGAKVIKIIN